MELITFYLWIILWYVLLLIVDLPWTNEKSAMKTILLSNSLTLCHSSVTTFMNNVQRFQVPIEILNQAQQLTANEMKCDGAKRNRHRNAKMERCWTLWTNFFWQLILTNKYERNLKRWWQIWVCRLEAERSQIQSHIYAKLWYK